MINYSNATFFCIFLNLGVDRIPKKQFNTLRCQAVANNDNASIAQSVEQGIENPRVGGSIPPRGTTIPPQFSRQNGGLLIHMSQVRVPQEEPNSGKPLKNFSGFLLSLVPAHKSSLRLKWKLLSIRINSVSSHLFSLSSFLML